MRSLARKYELEDPQPCTPAAEESKDEERSLAPLAEERQVPTGLDNPFWKRD